MASQATFNYIDYSGERASNRVYLPEVAADGSNYQDVVNAVDAVKVAIGGFTRLNFNGINLRTYEDNTDLGIPPTDPDAQREVGVAITYRDTVTNKAYTLNIPAPPNTIKQSGTDVIDVENNVVFGAFATVLENNLVSEMGNPIAVVAARFTRRSR